MKVENTKTIQTLQVQIRALQEAHNRLTTQVALLSNELSKVKSHADYKEPELTDDEKARRERSLREFGFNQGTSGTAHPSGGSGSGGFRSTKILN